MSRLETSLRLLRTVNRFRATAARYPRHVAAELAYHEGKLQEHDRQSYEAALGDLRAIDSRDDPRQVRMPWR